MCQKDERHGPDHTQAHGEVQHSSHPSFTRANEGEKPIQGDSGPNPLFRCTCLASPPEAMERCDRRSGAGQGEAAGLRAFPLLRTGPAVSSIGSAVANTDAYFPATFHLDDRQLEDERPLLCPAAGRRLAGYCCWSFQWRNVNSQGAHRGRRGQQGPTLSSFNLQKDFRESCLDSHSHTRPQLFVSAASTTFMKTQQQSGPTTAQKESRNRLVRPPGEQILIFLEILSPRASASAHPSPLTPRMSKEERIREKACRGLPWRSSS